MAMSRVLVAMSGGVDSSVAAALLVEAGHEVVGVTMKTSCHADTPRDAKTCCGLEGISDARRVAAALGIAHHVFDMEEEFTRDVIDDFVSEYARGRTPNPCARCNADIKFRHLMARGRFLECERIASGHYVRIAHGDGEAVEPGGPALLRGVDRDKDQAYFLWGLPPEMLASLIFPVGELTKPEVRSRARALGLVTADKPESQEICFVHTGNYRDFLLSRLGPRHPALQPGPLVSTDGTVLGEHRGYAGFTVGQRKGLGGGFLEPMFVLEIRPDTREVVVGTREESFTDLVEIGGLNWLTRAPPVDTVVRVQLRHRARAVPASVRFQDTELHLELGEAVAAVTPGQSAVVFDERTGEQVLGGGRILRARRTARRTPHSPSGGDANRTRG